MAHKTISFRIFHNDQLIETRNFARDVIKLGRLSSSHVQLDDLAVGRMHAVIEVGQSEVRAVDLGSTAGTALNGEAFTGSKALRSGDSLAVGPYRLELTIADTATAAVPAPMATSKPAPHQARTNAPEPRVDIDLSTVEDEGEVAEVITSYGRSILDVAHVGQTRNRTKTALPLLALGGMFMAGGIGLFGYEVAQPWDQHREAVAEAQQHHREAPEAPGLGTGSLGMGLALLGLVPFVGGLMRRRDVSLDAYIIGEGSEANFKVPGDDLPNPGATELVSRTEAGYTLAFTPSMKGSVAVEGHELSLHDLIASGRAQTNGGGSYRYMLPRGARAKVEHGDVRFSVNLVKRGAVVAGRGEVDWPFWGYFGGTATIATAFYMLMRSMPDDALAMQLADDEAAARFATYFHQADEVEKEEPVETVEPETDQESMGGETGQRASGTEGRMGDRTAKNTGGHYELKGPSKVPQLARNFDPVADASRAGILGILASQDKSFIASVDGGAFSVGQDDADIWGNLTGVEAAASYGVGGLGLLGDGGGGGGTANGLVGLGGVGLLGHGPGDGGSYRGPGDGGVTGFGKHKRKTPAPRVGKGTVKGAIDKDMIRRIVRAHINEVRSCYNQGLSKNPNLQGRVSIQFSIVGNGKVGSSVVQGNTTKDSAVASCIAKAVKRWKFPTVRNGGTALVTYPFMLESR